MEVNARVNYPLKRVLIKMEEDGQLDLDDCTHKLSISWLTLHVANVGIRLFVSSWNAHKIPSEYKVSIINGGSHTNIVCIKLAV